MVKSASVVNDNKTHQSAIEQFSNLNTILHSLVDYIRPEIYIAQDELQIYNELKDKFRHQSTIKQKKNSSNTTDIQSIRSTSEIYRFLAQHQKIHSTPMNNKQNSTTTISRDELLKKLHEKMPHRQQQSENQTNKRQRSKDKPKQENKRPKTTTTTPTKQSKSTLSNDESTSSITNQITFGRFEFQTDNSIMRIAKKNKQLPNKQKQLIQQLKQIESEQNQFDRLNEENPEQAKVFQRSKHWQTAMAKAKGEKIRDNPKLLRKTIKKQTKRRQHSAIKWKKNQSETDKRMKQRQDKRQTNLQKRKEDKKAKLKKRLIKKGRLIS